MIRKRKQPLDWADLQKKVPDVVRLGYYEDATSALEPMARAGGALSGIVGRRAHCRRRVSRDSADDSAALRRSLGNRIDERAARRPESGGTGARSGNISRNRAARGFRDGLVAAFCTTDLLRTCHAEGQTADVQREHGRRSRAHALGADAAADARFARDRSRPAVMRSMTAVTSITAGFRKCPTRSRN